MDATTRGKLGQLSASSLQLLVKQTASDGNERFVPQPNRSEQDIAQVRLRRSDSIWTGTVIGFTPGATIGMLILFNGAGCDCYTISSRAPIALWTMALAGGIGAGIGAAVDAAMVEHQTVFMRAPRNASGIHISPSISASKARVNLAIGF